MCYKKMEAIYIITNGDDPISLLMLGIYSIMLHKKRYIELTISDIQKNPLNLNYQLNCSLYQR